MGKIGRGTSYILAGKIIVLVIAFINAAFVPRYLGPAHMGFYSYWLAVFYIFTIILDLSASALITRFVPELKETDEGKVPVLLMKLIKMKFYLIPVLILAGIFFFRKYTAYFLVILAASLVMSISTLMERVIYSYGKMRAYTFNKIIQPALRILLVICGFTLFKEKGIIIAIIGLNIIICLGLTAVARRLLPAAYNRNTEIALKDYFGFSILAYTGSLFSVIVSRMAMIFSRHYIADMKIIGFLGFGILICIGTIRQIISGISESILPYIIELKATDSQHTFKRSMEHSWKYTNILLFPLIFAIFILGPRGIEFIAGKEYLPSLNLIFLLLPAVVFYSWTTVQENKFFAEGKANRLCWINLSGFLIFCVCSIILIKRFGITGSAFAIILHSLVTFVLTFISAVQKENIFYYWGGSVFKPLIASIIMAVCMRLFDISTIWRLCVTGFSGIAIYGIVMVIIKGITPDDIKRFSEALFASS